MKAAIVLNSSKDGSSSPPDAGSKFKTETEALIAAAIEVGVEELNLVSKVFTESDAYPGTFMTTIAINSGNSGGPIFNLEGNLVGVAYAALNKLDWIKAGLAKEIPLPTDMGYAIQSKMINNIIKYKPNKKYKNKKYQRADLYEKMLPSVVVVAVLVND